MCGRYFRTAVRWIAICCVVAIGHDTSAVSAFPAIAGPPSIPVRQYYSNALNFDGTNDYVYVPRMISDNFTIEFWFKTNQANVGGGAWYNGASLVWADVTNVKNDFGSSIGQGYAQFGIGNPDTTVSSTLPVNDGCWHHFAGVRDKTNDIIRLYIDGVQNSSSSAGGVQSLTDPVNINIGGGSYYFKGSITEIRIWNVARTASEILGNMYNPVPVANSTLVAYYSCNKGIPSGTNSGSTLSDLKGTNNGSMVGFAMTGSTSNWVKVYDPIFPLDNITSAATAAYSFRRLKSSYTGKAVRVRRASDSAEADISMDSLIKFKNGNAYYGVDGNSTATITSSGSSGLSVGSTLTFKTFFSGTSCYVKIWYDQSGNGKDLSQSTTSYQPRIVNSGTLDSENFRPFIRFFGTTGSSVRNNIDLSLAMTTVGTVSTVMRLVSGSDGFILSDGGSFNYHSNNNSGQEKLIHSMNASTSVSGGTVWSNGTSYSPTSGAPWPSALSIITLLPSTPGTGTTWGNLGSDRVTCHNMSGGSGYCELAVFSTALSTAERQVIEKDQSRFYNIALAY